MAPGDAAPYQIKGYVLRGFVSELARRRLTGAVLERVSAAARDALGAPPPATAWVDGALLIEIEVAIEAIAGVDMVRQISHDAVLGGVTAALRPIVQGVLRLFGASPHSILERITLIATASNRGLEFTYSRLDERSGELVMTFPSGRNVPTAIFEGLAGALSSAFETCGVTPTIPSPELLPTARRNSARFHLTW
jgi:hypothetical protein